LYQKFITKNGKKIGPYFYESIRLPDGTVKTIYLGNDEQVALQKLQLLHQQDTPSEQSLPLQQPIPQDFASSPTPQAQEQEYTQPLSPIQQLLQRIAALEQQKVSLFEHYRLLRSQYQQKIISDELYTKKYAELFGQETPTLRFIRYDSDISVCEQEIMRLQGQEPLFAASPTQSPHLEQKNSSLLIPTSLFAAALLIFLFFFHPSLTGFASLSSEQSGEDTFRERIDIITNASTTYVLNVTPDTPITSLRVSGSYEQGGSIHIYLLNDNYIVYVGAEQQETLFQKIKNSLLSFFSGAGVTGNAVLETTGTSFFIRNDSWQEIPFTDSLSEDNLTFVINSSSFLSLTFSDLEGNSFMISSDPTLLTPPEGFTFKNFLALNFTDLNFTNATLERTAQGFALSACPFWDFDFGICLGSWKEALNLTPGENYSLVISPDTSAYAEIDFLPQAEPTNETSEPIAPPSPQPEASNLSSETLFFSEECVSTCNIVNFTGSAYKLVIIVNNTTLNLSSVIYTVASEQESSQSSENVSAQTSENASAQIPESISIPEEEENQQQSINQTPQNQITQQILGTGNSRLLLDNLETKITYNGLDKQKPKNILKKGRLAIPQGTILGDTSERVCEGHTCRQIIYQKPKYLVKEDGTIDLMENALEQNCDAAGDLCVKGKDYRAQFKQTTLEQETITFTKNNFSIGFQPLQIRYANLENETLLSSANPVYSYGDGDIVHYQNIFGPGTEIRLTYQSNQLKEEIIFFNNSLFLENNIPFTEGYIFIDYLVNLSDDLSFISKDGAITPPSDSIFFFNSTSLDSATENIAILPQPFVSSGSSLQFLDYGLSATPQGTVLSVRIPVEAFSQASYPVIVDPTITLNTSNGGIIFDGFITFDIGTPCYERSSTGSFFYVGRSEAYFPACTFAEPPVTFSRADIDWDVSSLPRNADLVDANLTLGILAQSAAETQLHLFQMEGNSSFYPDTSSGNINFYNDTGNGTSYVTQTVSGGTFENFNLTNHTSFAPDFEFILWNQIGWWSVGITSEEGTTSTNAFQIGSKEAVSSANAPILVLDYDLPPPSIILNALSNTSTVSSLEEIVLNATVTDNEPEIQEIVFYASNKTEPDGDDIIAIVQNFTQGTEVVTNWTSPVWEPDQNTVLLMHFNNRSLYGENDTQIFDYSPESNNGTIVSTSDAVHRPLTKFNFTVDDFLGGSLEFNNVVDVGVAENISLGDQDELIGLDYTWMFRFLPRINATNNYGVLLNKLTGTTGFAVGQTGGGLFINSGDGVGFTSLNFTDIFVPLEPIHIAITLDSSNVLKVYINGTLYNTTDGVLIGSNTAPFEIGLQDSLDITTQGSLDELVILNRTLTATEIANSYHLPSDVYHWFVNATDYSGEPLGVNMSEIRTFTLSLSVPIGRLTDCSEGCLYLRDPLGNNMTILDKSGNLDTKGNYTTFSVASPDGNDLRVYNRVTGNQTWIDGATGNIYLSGALTYNTGTYCTSPAQSFVIRDSSGNCVAYFDNAGNLWLKGGINANAAIT